MVTARSARGPLPVVGQNQLPQAAALAFAIGSSRFRLMALHFIFSNQLSARLMQCAAVVKARLMAAPDGARPPMYENAFWTLQHRRISLCLSSPT